MCEKCKNLPWRHMVKIKAGFIAKPPINYPLHLMLFEALTKFWGSIFVSAISLSSFLKYSLLAAWSPKLQQFTSPSPSHESGGLFKTRFSAIKKYGVIAVKLRKYGVFVFLGLHPFKLLSSHTDFNCYMLGSCCCTVCSPLQRWLVCTYVLNISSYGTDFLI